MLSSEIRGTVMIGVSLFLLSILLSFAAFLMYIVSDFANARNGEILAQDSVSSFREFNKYNGQILYGEDVVAAIRDYFDTDIRIRVNNFDGVYEIDKYKARQNPDLVKVEYLLGKFPVNRKYSSVLVYGDVLDLSEVKKDGNYTETIGNNVTAIVFFDEGVRD